MKNLKMSRGISELFSVSIDQLQAETRLDQIAGFDSIGLLQLILIAESETGSPADIEKCMAAETVGELEDHLYG